MNQPTHLHGHTLDLILSPSDVSVVHGVKVCNFISNHALIKCSVDFPRPVVQPSKNVSFRKYHRIDRNVFWSEINEIPFVKSSAGTVSELYKQNIHDLSAILHNHAPVMTQSAVEKTVNWLSDSYRLLDVKYELIWRKIKNLLTSAQMDCSV